MSHIAPSGSASIKAMTYRDFLTAFARWGAWLAVCVGIVVLAGWIFHIRIFMTLLPGLVAMKVNTACCFIAAGLCLSILRAAAAHRRLTWLARGLAAGVAIVGGLSLVENVLNRDFGIDQFLMLDDWQSIPTPHPGRMAAVAGFNFFLVGCAMLCLRSRRPRLASCVQWIVAPILFVALLAIVEYAYGVELPDQMKHYNLMAVHTILTFFVLALSIVAMDSSHGFAKIAVSDTAGGLVARRLIPAVPLALFGLGEAGLMAERAGLYVSSFGLALNVVLSTTIGVVALSMTAAALHRIDLRRRHIEAELIGLNVTLERRVAERTEQLDMANRSLLRDASERRHAQEALKDSEARYRLLADGSSDIVTRLSLDGVLQYASPASIEILGFTPDEMVGIHLDDLTHPDDLDGLNDAVAALGTDGVDQGRSTHRARHRRGHWVWVDVQFRLVRDKTSGEQAEIVCSVRDVSRREKLQEQVVVVADLLKATLDSMDQGLIVLARDGRVQVSNHRAFDLFGERQVEGACEPGAEAPPAWSPNAEIRVWLLANSEDLTHGPCEYEVADGRIVEVRRTAMGEGAQLLTFSDISHLKRAENDARDANRSLLMAEEVAHLGHWRLDLRAGSVVWSDEVFRIHGFDPARPMLSLEEAIGCYHPDDRPVVERHVGEAIAARQSFEFSLRLIRPDGEIRNVMSRGFCEIDAASHEVIGLFGVFMDITDLTRAERELERKSVHLQITLEKMDQGLVKVAADGRVELVNRRFGELMGLEGDNAAQPGMVYADVLERLAERGDVIRLTSGERLSLPDILRFSASTFERHRPDGVILEVATVILPDGSMIRTFSDITARRQGEVAVQDSEARYRMLAETTGDMIMQLDLDMRRIYVSPACRLLVGHEPADMLQQSPSEHMHPEDAPGVYAQLQALVSGSAEGDTGRATYRTRHKEGHWVWVEASASLLRDAEGKPKLVITSLRDVTERQRLTRHLERAKTAAENAGRQKSEFVANMSHELRTPLTGILGIHDLLQRDPTLGPQQRRYIEMARDAGRSLLSIVNDVLDFSKIEAGQLAIEKVPFRLTEVVEACAELANEAARKKALVLTLRTEGADVALMGDPARLRQVLLNLMTNAVKFTSAGGVTVEAGYRTETSRMRVEVTDTGIGIPEDKLPLLFGRFRQADASTTRRYGGTGLGLAICKRLVELMGGEIGVTSVDGSGSTFWFELPLGKAAGSGRAEPASPQGASTAGCRVLLAEDNFVNQEIIAAMLTQRGYDVTVADNGAAAAAAAARRQPCFDLILMDIQMPVMDGLSATRVIRNAEVGDGRAAVPIIGLTANAMLEDVERCLGVGMMAHVAKPIDWVELFATIERVMESASAREGCGPAWETGSGADPMRRAINAR